MCTAAALFAVFVLAGPAYGGNFWDYGVEPSNFWGEGPTP